MEANAWSSDQPPEPFSAIQEEVDRLPERYRAPIILCYLEGLTQQEAASQLRLPASTFRVRLMRARSRLRNRLLRRGLAPAVLAQTSASRAEAAIPALLLDETKKAAIRIAVGRAAAVSEPVAALVKGAIRAMFFAKLKMAAALVASVMLASLWMISSLCAAGTAEAGRVRRERSSATAPAARLPRPEGGTRGDRRDRQAVTLAANHDPARDRESRPIGRRLHQDLRLSEEPQG